MAASTILLDSDASTPLSSISFGSVLAGTASAPKLIFVNANGDSPSQQVSYGVEAVSGSDGYSFTEICQANSVDALGITVSGTVNTGGSIDMGTIIEYKVSVKDNWGHESALCPASFQPSIAVASSKVALTWNAVTGAFKYVVYSKVGSGSFKKVAETAIASYMDLLGTNDGVTAPQVSGSAYAEGTWQTGTISIGTIPNGTKIAVMLRENVPNGSTATGNPRSHKIFVSHVVI